MQLAFATAEIREPALFDVHDRFAGLSWTVTFMLKATPDLGTLFSDLGSDAGDVDVSQELTAIQFAVQSQLVRAKFKRFGPDNFAAPLSGAEPAKGGTRVRLGLKATPLSCAAGVFLSISRTAQLEVAASGTLLDFVAGLLQKESRHKTITFGASVRIHPFSSSRVITRVCSRRFCSSS